jgi:hypothetical protein
VALAVAVPVVVVGAVVLNQRGGSHERPRPVVGDVAQIVGGGTADEPALVSIDEDDGKVDALAVDATGVVAMAVTPSGTLWLVDREGNLFRSGVDGRVAFVTDEEAPPIGRHAAMTVAPNGDLLLVTDRGDVAEGAPVRPYLGRIDPDDRDTEWHEQDLSVLPDGVALTGVAAAPDGRVFVADGSTGIVYVRDGALVQPVPFTGDLSCVASRREFDPPTRVNLTLTDDGELVVVDPFCLGLYSPTSDLDVDVEGLDRCPGALPAADVPADPGSVVEALPGRLVIAGWACSAVWVVDEAAVPTVLLRADKLPDHVDVVAADNLGYVYLLDPEDGVFVARLPPLLAP